MQFIPTNAQDVDIGLEDNLFGKEQDEAYEAYKNKKN
jgi:hypothetical protein